MHNLSIKIERSYLKNHLVYVRQICDVKAGGNLNANNWVKRKYWAAFQRIGDL